METKQLPKFHVVERWLGESKMLCVELVEIAMNPMEQLLGGEYGIRIKLLDTKGETSFSFIACTDVAADLIEQVGNALKMFLEMEPKKGK